MYSSFIINLIICLFHDFLHCVCFQGHLSQLNESHMETTGLIGDILKQVAKAADQLEMDLDDHPFDKAIHNLVGPVRN